MKRQKLNARSQIKLRRKAQCSTRNFHSAQWTIVASALGTVGRSRCRRHLEVEIKGNLRHGFYFHRHQNWSARSSYEAVSVKISCRCKFRTKQAKSIFENSRIWWVLLMKSWYVYLMRRNTTQCTHKPRQTILSSTHMVKPSILNIPLLESIDSCILALK